MKFLLLFPLFIIIRSSAKEPLSFTTEERHSNDLSWIPLKRFSTLIADTLSFEKFSTHLNPIFKLTNVSATEIANRILLANFISQDIRQLIDEPYYSQKSFFELNLNKRSYYVNLLQHLKQHLKKFPDDSSLTIWVANIYLKLGNIPAAVDYLQAVTSILDTQIEALCSGNMMLREIPVRSEACEHVMLRRTQVANRAGMVALMAARSATSLSERQELTVGAMELWRRNFATLSRLDGLTALSPPSTNPGLGSLPTTTRSSLRHSLHQLQYLCDGPGLGSGLDSVSGEGTTWLGSDGLNCSAIIQAFKYAVKQADLHNAEIPPGESLRHLARGRPSRYLTEAEEHVVLPDKAVAAIGPYLYRQLHSSASSGLLSSPAINLTTVANLRSRSLGSGSGSGWALGSRVLVIDDLLTTAALEAFRAVSLESTMWHAPRSGGYMCAFMDMGFASPLVAQTVAEMQQALPELFCDYHLTNAWGYKYADGDEAVGTNMHADFAAVNVNCWTVPEEHVQDRSSGGMIVWPTRPPANWSTLDYNQVEGVVRRRGRDGRFHVDLEYEELESRRRVERWAANSEATRPAVTVPYRSNRCVIFDSSFLHATARVKFGKGFTRRRVNLTFLFGAFRQTCSDARERRLEQEAAARLSKAGL